MTMENAYKLCVIIFFFYANLFFSFVLIYVKSLFCNMHVLLLFFIFI